MKNKKEIQNFQTRYFKDLNKEMLEIGLDRNEVITHDFIRLKYRESIKATQNNKYNETDKHFVKDIGKIAKGQQSTLLSLIGKNKKARLTDQQCDKIDHYARLHYKANIVNKNTDNQFQQVQQNNRCNCGCQRTKGQKLPLCANIKQMSILGSGVVLLFMFKKTFSIILLSAVLIYAIYAIVTNLMGSSSVTASQCQDVYCQYRTRSSSQNKYQPQTFTVIQWWIGLGFCVVWIFILRLIKYFGKSEDQSIDQYLNSSSDYAIILQNLPYGQYDQNDLTCYFDLLYEKSLKYQTNEPKTIDENNSQNNINQIIKSPLERQNSNKFNMKSIQIIYNMEFSRALVDKILSLSIQINKLFKAKQQNPQSMQIKAQNIQIYKTLKKQICQTFELLVDLRKKFLYDNQFRKNISTTVAIVQFHQPQDKDFFLKHFGNQKVGLLKQMQQKIKKYFQKDSRTVMFRGNVLKIQRAPQPSDLIYKNCQKKFSYSRIFVIYLLTFGIIMMSFAIITILVYFQDKLAAAKKNQATGDMQDDTTITIMNIFISIGLQIVNRFLWFALFYILDIEYNHTLTQKIISQMNKVLFATCVNIIALPIISNYVIRNNVYGSKGLAGMVFDYQISVLGVGLIMKLIDPANFVKRILLNIRTFRNMIIRFLCEKLVKVDPEKGVPQINSLYEGNYFDIAESYVYVMAATYQAVFFCQLQPSLLILVTLVVVVFYWVNKFKVLRTCKIPQITEVLIFQTALSQAAMIPVIFGAGTIVLSYIQTHYNPSLPLNYTTAIISIAIGFFGFFNPGNCLNKTVKYMMNKLIKKQADNQTTDSEASAKGILDNFNTNPMSDTVEDQPQILNRLDNYFRDSNSLSLIGFQHIISGGGVKYPLTVLNQLQKYCQNFINNEDQMNKVNKKIKSVLTNNIFFKDEKQLAKQGQNDTSGVNTQKIILQKRISKIKLPKLLQNAKQQQK